MWFGTRKVPRNPSKQLIFLACGLDLYTNPVDWHAIVRLAPERFTIDFLR